MTTSKIVCAVIVMATICSTLSGCAATPMPVSGEDLQITYATGPMIPATQYLAVFITNMSMDCVEFPDDFGIRIWYRDGATWKPTGNLWEYESPQHNRLERHGSPYDTTSFSLKPDLQGIDSKAPVDFKATIKGHACNQASEVVEKDIPFTVMP